MNLITTNNVSATKSVPRKKANKKCSSWIGRSTVPRTSNHRTRPEVSGSQ